MDTSTSPLVVLGMDVGDPNAIEQWAAQGYLPTIAKLMQRGAFGKTGGPELVSELGIWVSIFSGLARDQHNYFFLRQLIPGTYDLQPFDGRQVDAKPFWHSFLGREKAVAIVDVPDVYPIPALRGIQLADWQVHFAHELRAEPSQLLKQVRQSPSGSEIVEEKLSSSYQEDLRIYQRLLKRVSQKGEACREFLRREKYDLIVVVFGETHTASHQFWKYRPEASAATTSELTHAVRDIYQRVDEQMGQLLTGLPHSANVCLVTSNGIQDIFPMNGLTEDLLHKLHYQTRRGLGGSFWNPMALARRVLPEDWRIALGRLAPNSVQERILADQLRASSDWQATLAYAIPATYMSFVRVNLRGREPQGIVEPGEEYDRVLTRLESDFFQLAEPGRNARAVHRIDRVSDLFGCDPHPVLPDLMVTWESSDHFIPRLVHPHTELNQRRPGFFRSNEHSFNGFFAAAGPGIRPIGLLGEISLLDLAPTFLALMDEEIPVALRGRPIRAMLN